MPKDGVTRALNHAIRKLGRYVSLQTRGGRCPEVNPADGNRADAALDEILE